jgi:hypothetical protein
VIPQQGGVRLAPPLHQTGLDLALGQRGRGEDWGNGRSPGPDRLPGCWRLARLASTDQLQPAP